VSATRVTAGFFRTLGITPVLGRDFLSGEDLHKISDAFAADKTTNADRFEVGGAVLLLESVPRPARDAEAVRNIIGGPVIAGHRCCGRPREVVVQHLSHRVVASQSNINKSLVEASNRPTVHFVVFSVAAVNLDHARLVAIAVRIPAGATECLGPVRSESLSMFGVKAVAERMRDHVIGHYSTMPGVGKTAHAVHSAGRFENRLHISIIQSACMFARKSRPCDEELNYGVVAPLSLLTIRLETLTGSKSPRVKLIRQGGRNHSFAHPECQSVRRYRRC